MKKTMFKPLGVALGYLLLLFVCVSCFRKDRTPELIDTQVDKAKTPADSSVLICIDRYKVLGGYISVYVYHNDTLIMGVGGTNYSPVSLILKNHK